MASPETDLGDVDLTLALQCPDREYSERIPSRSSPLTRNHNYRTTGENDAFLTALRHGKAQLINTFVMLELMLTSKGIRVTCLGDALVRTPLNFLVSHD